MRVLGFVVLSAWAIVGAASTQFFTEFVVRRHSGSADELLVAVYAWLVAIQARTLVSDSRVTVLAQPAP